MLDTTSLPAAMAALAAELRHLFRENLALKQDIRSADIVPPPDLTPPIAKPIRVHTRGKVLDAAVAEWERGVREPPKGDATRIDEYIRGPQGLGWGSADVQHLGQPIPYTRNGQFQWCGAFAAFCYGAAGLKAEHRKKAMASTSRLYRWAKGTARMVPFRDMVAGDILIVGPEGDVDGAHICLVERLDPDGVSVDTIEGNASGRGVDGKVYEGVVRQRRPLPRSIIDGSLNPLTADPWKYRAAFCVRPVAGDFDEVQA